uniref:Uncharacterized protein n=1 Tax=Lygus hesperus TaxID=30085 RepID=A0A0K8TFF7_LYGHE
MCIIICGHQVYQLSVNIIILRGELRSSNAINELHLFLGSRCRTSWDLKPRLQCFDNSSKRDRSTYVDSADEESLDYGAGHRRLPTAHQWITDGSVRKQNLTRTINVK